METVQEYNERKERQAQLEHRDVLLAIAAILKTKEGLQFFKYLFKHLEVATIPEQGMEGNVLHDFLGFLRAGNSIYKLACEAECNIAASILSKIEREKYDDLIEQTRIYSGDEPG